MLKVYLDNVNIEQVDVFNCIGLTLDEYLTCKCHKINYTKIYLNL